MPELAYVLISPDPRHWQPLNPIVQQLPGAHAQVNAAGTNFYVKIGDQTDQGLGAIPHYKRANPSFFWMDISIQNCNGQNGVGKTLETMIFGQVINGVTFKHIGHGEEWYYCFNGHAGLLNFINNVCAGQDYLAYQDVNAAYNAIQQYFRTA